MYAKKPRKKLKDSKSPIEYYTLNNNHVNKEILFILGFDPGMVNPAIHVESRNLLTNEIISYLNLKIDIYEFFDEKIDKNINFNQAPIILYSILNKYKDIILKADIVIIEKQLPENYKSVCISKYFLSWIMINLTNALILEIDSKAKYRYLDCPKELNEHHKKKWGITKALELLELRGDMDTYNLIMKSPLSKRDDLSDAIIIVETYFVLHNIAITQKYNQIYKYEYCLIDIKGNNPEKKPAIYGNMKI